MRFLLGLLGLGWAVALSAQAAAPDLSSQVLIVFNEKEPESRPLAEHYAQARHIPMTNLCAISIRPVETITRREFDEQVRRPIRDCWKTRSGIRYLALMYGVPLRIENDPGYIGLVDTNSLPLHLRRNDAAVDSELALLPSPNAPIWGAARNPFFHAIAPTGFNPPVSQQMLLVGRLDGPNPAVVRHMIDEAVATERHGLNGRVYLDEQAASDPGYHAGDVWLQRAGATFRNAGFECENDTNQAVYGTDAPLSDVAVYAGWYAGNVTGPFKSDAFRFNPGAVAVHIHSASGASLRTQNAYWVGPLLARGAAATLGNVFEPYLQMTPHLDAFFDRLLAGWTFLEAAYYSQPVLSWQTTFVGDPLYRPFALSLDEQLAAAASEPAETAEWLWLRKVNLLAVAGKTASAEELGRQKAEALASPVLFEKIGDLAAADHRAKTALELYGRAAAGYDKRKATVAARRVREKLTLIP